MSGVGSDGFQIKILSAIIASLETQARSSMGVNIDLTVNSPLKMFIDVVATEIASMWNTLEDCYYSGYIDFASGASLERVVALIGVVRLAATEATGEVTFTTNPAIAVTIPAGTMMETDDGVQYVTDSDVTATAGTVNATITAVIAGAGYDVAASTITNLVSVVPGVVSVVNMVATDGGADAETDEELRRRAKLTIDGVNKATVAAILAAAMSVAGVISVNLIEDFALHLVDAYIYGAYDPGDMATALDEARPAGIPVIVHVVVLLPIYADIIVDVNADAPADADVLIHDAIQDYIDELIVGHDVIYSKLFEIIYDVQGDDNWIEDITQLQVADHFPTGPGDVVNVVVDFDEKAVVTVTGDIVVTLV